MRYLKIICGPNPKTLFHLPFYADFLEQGASKALVLLSPSAKNCTSDNQQSVKVMFHTKPLR